MCGGWECGQVNHEKEARLAEVLEQAAKNAEQIACLTVQLRELVSDKVLLALIDHLCVLCSSLPGHSEIHSARLMFHVWFAERAFFTEGTDVEGALGGEGGLSEAIAPAV